MLELEAHAGSGRFRLHDMEGHLVAGGFTFVGNQAQVGAPEADKAVVSEEVSRQIGSFDGGLRGP